jgi:hypothetical protein
MPRINVLIRAAGAVAALTLTLTSLGAGQQQQQKQPSQGGGGAQPSRPVAPSNEDAMRRIQQMRAAERDMRERQFMLGMLEKQAGKPVETRTQQLAFAQISQDFMRMQVVNKDLAESASSNVPLDFKAVAKSVAEIRKCAARLKDNLALPEPEKGAKRLKIEVGPEPGQLKSSLLTLDDLIVEFVHNPMFKTSTANVVDAQHSAAARRNLEVIMNLSEEIKKSSESLRKVAQKKLR